MSEANLRKWYSMFSNAWKYLKDHSHYDITKDLMLIDGGDCLDEYTGFEYEIMKQLIVIASRILGEQYRRDRKNADETY